jgi:amidase
VFEELTIEAYHKRLLEGSITTVELVTWYLDRIEDHSNGAGINAVVSVNPEALSEAEKCDELLATSRSLDAPLHGVPVLVKDQGETAGIATTFGNKLFANYVPSQDAVVVARLKAAGAIVIGKSTMCDFAAGWFSSSSLTGHTATAYDTNRDSGGSSAGSGAGVGANLCLVAIGEDTGGSVRIPASFNNAYGLRVTTGLIPRTGFSPLVHFQDTPAPLARTVDDLARVLDAIAGYDPADEYTVVATQLANCGNISGKLTASRNPGDWTVGVVETAFGDSSAPATAPVNGVIANAIAMLEEAEVTVRRGLEIGDLAGWIARTSVYSKISKSDLTAFIRARPSAAPVTDFTSLYESNEWHPENDLFHDIIGGPDDVNSDVEFLNARINQDHFRRVVLRLFAEIGVDVLVYPTVQVIPPTFKDLSDGLYTCLTFPTNTVIASQAGLPALSVPAGFTEQGLPVGLEIVGRPFSEERLLQFAADVEPVLDARRAPVMRATVHG